MDLNFEIGKPGKGKLLISEPFLPDPSFRRTVVLLTEHNDEGSVGFVLNRPLNANINEALEEFPEFGAPLFMGGPVQPDTLHYIHKVGDKLEDSMEVLPGLFWGGDFSTLKILIETKQIEPEDIRFFIGYSGWAPDQLGTELEERSWVVNDASVDNVFDPDITKLWQNVLRGMGRQYAVMSNFPEDPSLN